MLFSLTACGDSSEAETSVNSDTVAENKEILDSDTTSNAPAAITPEFIAPGYGTEDTIAAQTLSNPSDWYGTITVSDYEGPYPETAGEFEAWAYIDTDVDGYDYFETYIIAPYYDDDSVVFSSWNIELHDYTFFPVVDDYAWILESPLREEDNTWYTPTLTNGVLSASYEYDYNGESFTFVYEFAQIDDGTSTETTDTTPDASTLDESISQEETPVEAVDIAPSFTIEELQAIADAMRADAPQDMTYGEWANNMDYATVLEKYTGGVEGVPSIDENWGTIKYQWFATDNETANFFVEFGSVDTSSDLRMHGYSAF